MSEERKEVSQEQLRLEKTEHVYRLALEIEKLGLGETKSVFREALQLVCERAGVSRSGNRQQPIVVASAPTSAPSKGKKKKAAKKRKTPQPRAAYKQTQEWVSLEKERQLQVNLIKQMKSDQKKQNDIDSQVGQLRRVETKMREFRQKFSGKQ